MSNVTLRGRIIKSQSGFYAVQTADGVFVSQLRGRLKRGPRLGDVVAVGDWVHISDLGGGNAVIETIEPRQRMISRLDPRPQGVYQQILIANPDQAFFVFACQNPEPHLGMVDRFLVIAEKQNLPAVIIANKVDLVGLEAARSIFGHYEPLGYPVIYTSVKTGEGVQALRDSLIGNVSLFSGPSGVGKSSLLNAIQPGLRLSASHVSEATGKGRHTTVVRELMPVIGGGYVADTPGLKALALWDIEPEELDGYFPELRAIVDQCAFSDCTHVHEPDCAVLSALEHGQIHPERYASYLKMR
ncbi:MAG TPA: ribosome small subunit-dependent GTPase A, partial [Anaerolineales bacterium]|nr:ribosome small subunit-dependent GTPase A [Anaerolineales bacterium]